MYEKGYAKIEKRLFYLMLIFSCLAYIGYYIYAKRSGINLLISYSRSDQAMMQVTNLFVLFFRFGKDVCAALLLSTEMLSMNRSYRAKIFLEMVLIIAYGTIIAWANSQSINTIVSGYRMVMYFAALIMFFNAKYLSGISLKKFLNVLTALLSINTLVAAIQAYDKLGFHLNLIGQGSYRFMGFFPAAAAFAYFCLGTALFAYCIDSKTNLYHKRCIAIYIIAFVGCYLSGTRSSMINLLIVFFVYIISQARMKKEHKILLSVLLAPPAMLYILQFSTSIAKRGSILGNALGGGRFTIFFSTIFKQPVTNILFGNGIGAGSNSAAVFMEQLGSSGRLFLDGTFTTVFYQFGVLGFLGCLAFIWISAKLIYRRNGFFSAALFAGTIVLQCLTTNILEAYALLIMLFVSYYTLTKGDRLFAELRGKWIGREEIIKGSDVL